MNYRCEAIIPCHAHVAYSEYTGQNGVNEYNVIIRSLNSSRPIDQQLAECHKALRTLIDVLPSGTRPLLIRYMLSDVTNQAKYVTDEFDCAVSVIGQPPVDGSKVAMWVYMLSGVTQWGSKGDLFTATYGGHTHMFTASRSVDAFDSQASTEALLHGYSKELADNGCTLEGACQRTWFFVRDVDVNYRGVVIGRNRVFDSEGLTRHTHFIASTGISGNNADPQRSVTMDAYAVTALSPDQITYLKAPEYLNPTAEYGVAFERGTAITYADRRHLIISGTASINNKGEVMYPGDIKRQTERMLLNIEALLAEGGCTCRDITHMIVYLRDITDYRVVNRMFRRRYPGLPYVIVWAPVCRPGWLIEAECTAISDLRRP